MVEEEARRDVGREVKPIKVGEEGGGGGRREEKWRLKSKTHFSMGLS